MPLASSVAAGHWRSMWFRKLEIPMLDEGTALGAIPSVNTTVLETENATKRAAWKLPQDVTRHGDAEGGDGGWIMPFVTYGRHRAGGTWRELWVRVV